MVLVRRPGYRLGHIVRGELKPLHPWHHLYWFLFGFSLCEFCSLWSSSWQALVHWKRISYASSFMFSMLEFLSVLIFWSFHLLPCWHFNLSMICSISFSWSWVVLYVRTLSFSIALKQAQDHQNRSSYGKVMLVLAVLFSAWEVVPPGEQ